MVRWTKEQQTAIDYSGSNILVAAAAGSGKTAVLVERIIQKVINKEAPMDIDEIFVSTFTNAAAEEMRNRIGSALEKAIQNDPASHHLKKQLSLLQRASISTLHSFCTSVVRQYAYLLDIDPAFRIADEMEIDLIRQEVLDELLESAYSREGQALEDFFLVVDMFSDDRSDVKIGELILQLYQFANENPWPETWLKEIREVYHLQSEIQEKDIFWLNTLKERVKEDLFIYEKNITRAIGIAREPDGPYHYLEALEHDDLLIQTVLDRLPHWDDAGEYIASAKLKSLSSKKVECNEDKKEAIKKIRKEFREDWNKHIKSLFSRSLESHLEDMKKLYPAILQVTELVIDFKHRFTEVKREKAIVDFSDLEHFCLKILIEPESTMEQIIPSAIAKNYQKQFKEILVDEYQDINIVQETILTVVSNQSQRGNMFMVGDVKQSIYRFRHAEPTLFIEKYNQFQHDESKGLRIDLAKNFRSRADVLTGANFLFRQLFDVALGEIDYDQQAELIYGNLGYEEFPLDDKEAELIIINRKTEEEAERTEDGENVEDLINIQFEARKYAQKIKQWTGGNGHVPLQVIDKQTNQKRDVQFRDIVILKRSLTGASTIVDELKKQGIPVHAELKSGYFAAIEIKVMINMLKIIDNPYQDIPLASVLRSPVVGLTEEELSRIRLTNRKGTFYHAVKDYAQTENIPKLNRFLKQLATFQISAKQGALSELIWEIYTETGYYDFVGGIPGGRQRQANLRALFDRARGYEATSFRGLFRFLRFIERIEEEGKDLGEARALSEQEDVIRIMTIHKSKGLEFPVVILGGINQQFYFRELSNIYMLDKDLGFASKFIDPVKRITYPTLYYTALQQEARNKMLAEEMRVLYVALTRAKEKLVMVGNVRSADKLIEKWEQVLDHEKWVLPMNIRKKAKSFLDWVGPALVRHQQNTVLRDDSATGDIWQDAFSDPSNWNIQLVPAEQLINVETELEYKQNEWQDMLVNWDKDSLHETGRYNDVDAILSFAYPFAKATDTRAKESVTEIKRRQEVVDVYSDQKIIKPFRAPLVKRPRFLQKELKLSSAEIGTAIHTIMQHLPFEGIIDKTQIKHIIDTLVLEEKLTESEAGVIDIEAIRTFLHSDIAAIIFDCNQIEREVPFTYSLNALDIYPEWKDEANEKVLIQGVVDCLIHTDDGLIILDYKTDAINESVITDAQIEKLKARYYTQMTLYKLAMEDILKQKVVQAYLYFFAKDILIKL